MARHLHLVKFSSVSETGSRAIGVTTVSASPVNGRGYALFEALRA